MPNPAQISDVQTTGKQEEIRESMKKLQITKQKRTQFIEKHHKTRQKTVRGEQIEERKINSHGCLFQNIKVTHVGYFGRRIFQENRFILNLDNTDKLYNLHVRN